MNIVIATFLENQCNNTMYINYHYNKIINELVKLNIPYDDIVKIKSCDEIKNSENKMPVNTINTTTSSYTYYKYTLYTIDDKNIEIKYSRYLYDTATSPTQPYPSPWCQ